MLSAADRFIPGQSTWQIDSLGAYRDLRAKTIADPGRGPSSEMPCPWCRADLDASSGLFGRDRRLRNQPGTSRISPSTSRI